MPWLWLLTQTTGTTSKTVRLSKIVEQIFSELAASNPGLPDFQWSLRNEYARRECCVQYQETDFQFVSRLLEEEGIFYYFRHEPDRHTHILADHPLANFPLADHDVECSDLSEQSGSDDQITEWQHEVSFRPGRVTHGNYNFEIPGARERPEGGVELLVAAHSPHAAAWRPADVRPRTARQHPRRARRDRTRRVDTARQRSHAYRSRILSPRNRYQRISRCTGKRCMSWRCSIGQARSSSTSSTMPLTAASKITRPFSAVAFVGSP